MRSAENCAKFTAVEKARISYNKQRIFCANLVIKTKISYFNGLNPSLVSDNETFRKTVKSGF